MNHGTSEIKGLCGFYATLITCSELMPDSIESGQDLFNELGLDSSLIYVDSNVEECNLDAQCLQQVANDNEYCPQVMASIVAAQIIEYLDNDGWNADGMQDCTGNCRKFSDTTGYEPETDDLTRWQPLEEDNGLGFFYQYNHVTPHIGFTARTKFTSRSALKERKSSDPNYNYQDEVEDVLDRLEDLATNDTQKMMVEFFDDKLSVALALLIDLDNFLGWTYEQRVVFLTGYGFGEYDAMITAWREKRIWDLVRPTTLIKNGLAGDSITTYGGPYQGVKTIDAEDFESYIRVMPHSEYPSASGCICLSATQYIDRMLKQRYNITDDFSLSLSFPPPFITYFPAGTSRIETGTTPSDDLYVTLSSLEEINYYCGVSRLWGGMHFTASIQGSYEVCDGIGYEAFEFMENIVSGNEAAFGDEEEIAPFQEEYQQELKLTLGKKYKHGKRKKKTRRKNL